MSLAVTQVQFIRPLKGTAYPQTSFSGGGMAAAWLQMSLSGGGLACSARQVGSYYDEEARYTAQKPMWTSACAVRGLRATLLERRKPFLQLI